MFPSPSRPGAAPSGAQKRTPSFALPAFPSPLVPPPSSAPDSAAASQQDQQTQQQQHQQIPFAFRSPALPMATPGLHGPRGGPSMSSPAEVNPWAALYAQGGEPTPAVHPQDSPFIPFNSFGAGQATPAAAGGAPAFDFAGPGAGARRGSLGGPVTSGMGRMTLEGLMSPPAVGNGAAGAAGALGAGAAMSRAGGLSLGGGSAIASRPRHPPSNGSASGPATMTTSGGQPIVSVLPSSLSLPIPSSTLVLDLRTHALYSHSHLPTSIPITIPSTLLRRPAFTLAKLLPMLACDADRAALRDPKRYDTIIVYDQDGSQATVGEGGVLVGLLNKFEKDGFVGKFSWVKGGFAAVKRSGVQGLVESGAAAGSNGTNGQTDKIVSGRDLPASAFQAGSTTQTSSMPSSRTPLNAPQAANPFFDNIRQNAELAHGGITERIPLSLPASTVARAADLPPFLRDLVLAPEDDAAERLARQFYQVEKGEQKRLQGIMEFHAGQTAKSASSMGQQGQEDGSRSTAGASATGADYFPYSITSGLEKGDKNRYKNIWPFDHARVRLEECCVDDGSDYINASFIQPRATHKRYIATQGPLPSTYRDFWTLCWEQNVRVIVMLTKQHEGGHVKCGNYWEDVHFGPLTLKPLGVEGGEDKPPTAGLDGGGGFFFAPPTPTPSTPGSTTSGRTPGGSKTSRAIKRSFLLSHADHPSAPGRLVTQLQYVGWPDFDIPETAEDILALVRDVDALVESAEGERSGPRGEDGQPGVGPVVVHCSAGVGRTGSFLIADAVLDAVKREIVARRKWGGAGRDSSSSSSGSRASTGSAGAAGGGGGESASGSGSTTSSDSTAQASSAQGQQLPQQPQPSLSGPATSFFFNGPSSFNLAPSPFHLGAPPPPSSMSTSPGASADPFSFDADGRQRYRTTTNESASSVTTVDSAATAEPEDERMQVDEPPLHPALPASLERRRSSTLNLGAMKLASSPQASPRQRFSLARVAAPTSPAPASAASSTSHPPSQSNTTVPSFFSSAAAPPASPQAKVATGASGGGLTAPRQQWRRGEDASKPPSPLADMDEPIQAILEDMRQQRMSLCQTLRQYVFAYRVVIQGILDLVDEDRGRDFSQDEHKKRQASPTELHGTLTKRPSLKLPGRRRPTPSTSNAPAVPSTSSSSTSSVASTPTSASSSKGTSTSSHAPSSLLHPSPAPPTPKRSHSSHGSGAGELESIPGSAVDAVPPRGAGLPDPMA